MLKLTSSKLIQLSLLFPEETFELAVILNKISGDYLPKNHTLFDNKVLFETVIGNLFEHRTGEKPDINSLRYKKNISLVETFEKNKSIVPIKSLYAMVETEHIIQVNLVQLVSYDELDYVYCILLRLIVDHEDRQLSENNAFITVDSIADITELIRANSNIQHINFNVSPNLDHWERAIQLKAELFDC